jgi:hypothetical protein
MTPKIKNILIFTTIAIVLVLGYIFFMSRSSSEEPNLVSSSTNNVLPNIDGTPLPADASNETLEVAEGLIALLSNVDNIKIDASIFSDESFISLRDSSILLIPDNTEGRPNPFAQIGNDAVIVTIPNCTPPQVLDVVTNTCVNETPN